MPAWSVPGSHNVGIPSIRRQRTGVVGKGEGVQVDHAEERVVLVLVGHEPPQGPQVVAEVQVTRGLDPGQHASHGPSG